MPEKEDKISNDQSMKLYHSIIKQSDLAFLLVNENGRIADANPAAERMFGFDSKNIAGLPVKELLGENSPAWLQITDRAKEKDHQADVITGVRKNGSTFRCGYSVSEVSDDSGLRFYALILNNLSDHKQFGKKFESLIREGIGLVAVLDPEGVYHFASPSYRSMLGFEEDELIGKNAFEQVHPDDQARVIEKFLTYRTGKKEKTSPYRFRKKDGSYIWLQSFGANLLDDPDIRGIVVHTIDATETHYYNRINNLEREILEKNLAGEKLESILETYIHGIEEIHPGLKCSVQKVVNGRLFNLVSPNLPESYLEAIEGLEIGEKQGACGTAAYLGEKVIIEDAETDERTSAFLDLVETYQFKALWSYPVKDEHQQVVATFAAYYHEPGEPGKFEQNSIERAAYLLQIILQNKRINYSLNERRKEQACLFDISKLNEVELSVDEFIEKSLEIIPDGFQYPEIIQAAIEFDGKRYQTDGYKEDEKKLVTESLRPDRQALKLAVVIPDDPQNGQIYFLAEEQELIDAVADLIGLKLVQKRTWLELEESNKRYEYVTQATSDAIWDYVPDKGKLFWGEGFKTLFGYNREKLDEGIEKWINNVHPKDVGRIETLAGELMSGIRKKWDEEYRFKKADGTYAYVRDKAIAVLDDSGKTERVVGAMEDITQKKKEEQQLKLMESVVTNTGDAVIITKAEPIEAPDGPEIVYVNEAFEKMTGYKPEEVIGKTPRLLAGPNSNHEAFIEFEEKLKRWEQAEMEAINYKKNGDEFWVHFSMRPVADPKGLYTHWIAIERDITERKNRDLKQKLISDISGVFNEMGSVREALERALVVINELGNFYLAEIWLVSYDEDTIELAASAGDEAKQFYDSDNSNLSVRLGKDLPGKTWKTGEVQFWKNLDKRKSFIRSEAAKKTGLKTGYGFPIVFNNKVTGALILGVKESPKKPQNFTIIAKDVALQLGEEIQRKSLEEDLASIFNSAPDIVCISGPDGYFKKINPAMIDLLGYSEKELLSRPYVEFVHPDDRSATNVETKNLGEGKPTYYFENRYITKSGNVIWVAWTATPYLDGNKIIAIGKDITSQKELEELLNQSNRLAKIGSWEVDLAENEHYWSDITREIHEVQPDFVPDFKTAIHFYKEGDDRDAITKAVRNATEKGTSWDLELRIITAKGNERWVRAIGEAEMLDGKCVRIYGSFQDIHDRKLIEQKLLRKTLHVDAIARLNSALINYHDWFNALEKHMEMIGESVNADRVYYFENRFDEETGEGFTTQKLEWCREGVTPQLDNPDLDELPFSEVPELIQPMLQNQPSTAIWSEVDEKTTTKYVMKDQDIKAFLAIPVFVSGRFHGFVGFDNCTEERYWNDDEITTLKTITSNLSIAIERHEADTALKAIYEERNTILESIGDGFFALDHEFTVTYWNSQAEELLFTPKEKVLHQYLWDVFDKDQAEESYQQYSRALKEKTALKFEDYYEPIDKWFDVNVYPSDSGISVFFKDISERKKSEEKLKELNYSLEKQARELAASNAELEQFAFVASHDLQEPLRMITSFLAQLEKKYNNILDDRGRQYIYYATDGAKRMRQIILDLLEYSRVGRINIEKERVDLNTVIENVLVLNKRIIQDTDAEIEAGEMPVIMAAKGPMRQLFQNLVSNALKYQPENNRPVIKIYARESESEWKFCVEDNGIGIHPEYTDKIFNIFQRLHRKEEYSGTGMGLAICKKIVEEHGGDIWVESEPGAGSTFYFTIKKNG